MPLIDVITPFDLNYRDEQGTVRTRSFRAGRHDVSDEVAEHPYTRAHLKDAPLVMPKEGTFEAGKQAAMEAAEKRAQAEYDSYLAARADYEGRAVPERFALSRIARIQLEGGLAEMANAVGRQAALVPAMEAARSQVTTTRDAVTGLTSTSDLGSIELAGEQTRPAGDTAPQPGSLREAAAAASQASQNAAQISQATPPEPLVPDPNAKPRAGAEQSGKPKAAPAADEKDGKEGMAKLEEAESEAAERRKRAPLPGS